MSKQNLYEVQARAFAKIKAGATAKQLWNDEYRLANTRQELRHIVGDNPKDEEYNKAIRGLLDNTEGAIRNAAEIGALATQEHELTMKSVVLAGSVLRSLVSVIPRTIPDAKDLLRDYQALGQNVNRELLEQAIEHLPQADRAVYQLDVVRLYGEKEVDEPNV